jgi:uncharacterized protein DUF2637
MTGFKRKPRAPKIREPRAAKRDRRKIRLGLPRRKPQNRVARALPAGTLPAVLRVPRMIALLAIAVLTSLATAVSLAESYRGLYSWALAHGLPVLWAAAWPVMIDVFLAVGELTLFVSIIDGWRGRSRFGAWAVTLTGLAASVGGNVGHITTTDLNSRGTAAVPPIAAAAAIGLGLGVLKRIADKHRETASAEPDGVAQVAHDSEHAARIALAATVAAGNPLSQRQIMTRFGLSREQERKAREAVTTGANGHTPQ